MKRRSFIKGLGAFFILPGAGRIWKAERPPLTIQEVKKVIDVIEQPPVWTYNKLPYDLANAQIWWQPEGSVWQRLFSKSTFPANLGETTRSIS